MTYDLVLKSGTIVTPEKIEQADIAIKDGKIALIARSIDVALGAVTENVRGLHILPGVIDSQVHFREPGLTHKEDLATGSRAAALGGVTTFLEMPNTQPATIDADSIKDKVARAEATSVVNFGFFIGATADNLDQLQNSSKLRGCCGVKIFLGSSTGDLLLYDEQVLRRLFSEVPSAIAVHSENEAMLKNRVAIRDQASSPHAHADWRDAMTALTSTQWIIGLARECGKKIHILHISTFQEMDFLTSQKDICTVEVTPQHLTLHAPECYDRLGTRAQMNPPIRSLEHQQGLWRGLTNGTVDVIGSDHAPHTLEEKNQPYPRSPSGMPGVQTLLPVMLNHVHEQRLSLETLVRLVCRNPARLYDLSQKGEIAVGKDADLTLVDLKRNVVLTDDMMASKCGWTPYHGMAVTGFPEMTFVHGEAVMRRGEIIENIRGKPVC